MCIQLDHNVYLIRFESKSRHNLVFFSSCLFQSVRRKEFLHRSKHMYMPVRMEGPSKLQYTSVFSFKIGHVLPTDCCKSQTVTIFYAKALPQNPNTKYWEKSAQNRIYLQKVEYPKFLEQAIRDFILVIC